MLFPWREDKAFGLPDYSVRAFLTAQLLLGWQLYIALGIETPEKYKYAVFAALGIYFGKEILIKILGNSTIKTEVTKAVNNALTISSVKKESENIKE